MFNEIMIDNKPATDADDDGDLDLCIAGTIGAVTAGNFRLWDDGKVLVTIGGQNIWVSEETARRVTTFISDDCFTDCMCTGNSQDSGAE